MEVSGDTHTVTLGTRGTAGTLGSGGTTGTGEAGSASNARSTLEEADEAVREQHGPSSQSQAGGEGHSRLRPWHQVDHQHRGCPAERKRRRRVMPGLAGQEAKGHGAIGCHLQQDQQRQQGRGDRAHHGHLGDLHCHELPGDQFHPGEEEEGGRAVSTRAALKPLTWLISPSICSSFPMEARPGETPMGLGWGRPRLLHCPRQRRAHGTLGFLIFGPRGELIRHSVLLPHPTLPLSTSFSQPRRCHPGGDGQAGPTLAPAAPGKPGGPAGPVGP